MALLRRAFALAAIAIIAGVIAFAWNAPPADAWMPGGTRARISDPPAVPCQQQIWPSIDRVCLPWTAPRDTAGLPATSSAVSPDTNRGPGRQP